MSAAARRLRVLHASNATARGGAEEHMLGLLRGLDRQSFEPHLACPPGLLRELPDLPADVRVHPGAPMTPWDAGAGWPLARYLRRHRVDIVHVHLSCASRAIAPWARLARVPTVIETPHVSERWRQGWKRGYWLDRVADRWLTGYVAVSHANADYLRNEKRLAPAKVWTIPNGIDLERFARATRAADDPRPACGIAAQERLLLCAARLEPQKGHAVLLNALAQLDCHAAPPIRLVCLGDGRLAAELRRQAEALGLRERVLFLGFCSQVEAWLAVADLCVLPSLYEGMPLVAMEAAAAGCPMVATAVDGTPEVVVPEATGVLVPPNDAAALAAALRRLLADPALRRRMAEQARAVAAQHFPLQRQVAATAALYCALGFAPRHGRASRAPLPSLPKEASPASASRPAWPRPIRSLRGRHG